MPRPTMVQELIAMHPLAYARASVWLMSVAGCGALGLVLHCGLLLFEGTWDADRLLRSSCVLRVLLAIPRPYGWWRICRLHMEACDQPTGLRVAQRCLAALNNKWVRLNSNLSRVYELWLGTVLVYLGLRAALLELSDRSVFEVLLLRHAGMCVGFLVAQKLLGSLFILGLLYWGQGETGLCRKALEQCSELLPLDQPKADSLREDPCIICFGEFTPGETARRLTGCGHVFHKDCIDEWLIHRRPRGVAAASGGIKCPVCSGPICVPGPEEVDPLVAREIEWIKQLQIRQLDGFHDGFHH